MTIANYSELISAIGDELNRDDLAYVIPTWIKLAEARYNRKLRVRYMVKRAIATLDNEYIAVPTDWLEAKNIQVNTGLGPIKLEYMTLEQADDYKRSIGNKSGIPKYFSVVGDQFEIIPMPSAGSQVELTYYAKIPALTETNTTNWLINEWPDLYFYGALIHSAPYLKDDPRIEVWSAITDRLLGEVEVSDERAQYSGSVLKARVRSY